MHSHDHKKSEPSCCHGGSECHPSESGSQLSQVSDTVGSRIFEVSGLDCAEEIEILNRALSDVVGGRQQLSFDVLRGRMFVSDQASSVSSEVILTRIAATGMKAIEVTGQTASLSRPHASPWRLWLTCLCGLSLVIALGIDIATTKNFGILLTHNEATSKPVAIAFYLLACFLGMLLVLPKAWFALRSLRPDMNLLMVIAVCGALALHQWLEAATVAFLFSISLMLESWSLQRARKAIEALIDTRPSAVRLVQDNGSVQMVAPEKVQINDKYLVKPGERIPLDGLLISGSTTVNESALTGESIPIVKELGAKVFAGTINGEGAFTATSLAKSDDTKLSQILRLIQQGQSKKAKVELWVERFARVYTPIVLVLAVLIGIVPPLMLNQDWSKSIYHALNLLVIACPCALVISTPVSIVAALTSAARFGVLVKGGTFLENAAQIQTLAFDKTGTLTEGKPSITDVIPLSGHNEGELLQRAATLESMSEHPLANAIVQYAKERGIEPAAVENFRMVPGKGAEGYFEGKRYRIGSSDYQREVIERNYSVDQGNLHHRIDSLKLQGKTVVVMSTEQHVCGLIALRDNLRRDAIDTVRLLKEAGVQKIVLLSGDHQSTVSVVGKQLGVQECYGGLLPEEKIAFIERLVQDGTVVAMVGDGINDAPALARATLGIAMGGGTDTALETCDIALINNQLTRLPWLIKHSRRTASIIKQNIALAIGVKLLFAGLTVLGVSTLWGAIAADLGASLVVIFNGLRLLKTS